MKKAITILASILCLILIYIINAYFTYDFQFEGDVKDGAPILSPDGVYAAQIYYENYGGAAGGVNIIVNIIDTKEENKEQTIYFSDAKGSVSVNWVSNTTLAVTNYDEYADRSMELIVGKEIYDERGLACYKYQVQKNYTCFSSKK
ncbi:DUF5412 family protein [Lysinibacillus sp. 54212]|uniref:DUF5412 family protein n=1 Tax=Lysinibacillus sp. 54212 TaxID=3119829 RepID=UPI002FCB401E